MGKWLEAAFVLTLARKGEIFGPSLFDRVQPFEKDPLFLGSLVKVRVQIVQLLRVVKGYLLNAILGRVVGNLIELESIDLLAV